jgi:hypothetical protein
MELEGLIMDQYRHVEEKEHELQDVLDAILHVLIDIRTSCYNSYEFCKKKDISNINFQKELLKIQLNNIEEDLNVLPKDQQPF